MTWTGMITAFVIMAVCGLVIWAGIAAEEEKRRLEGEERRLHRWEDEQRRLHREEEKRRLEWEDEQR